MLRSAHGLRHYKLHATDGTLGDVVDFLFDDKAWSVRYVVADTSRWLPGRKVLLAAPELGRPDAERHELPVSMSTAKVKDSPTVDADRPVSRSEETLLHEYYGWVTYWAGQSYGEPFGSFEPGMMPPAGFSDSLAERRERSGPVLRRVEEIRGYHVEASDGEIGRIEDMEVDDEGWAIRALLVETGGLFSHKTMDVPVEWVRKVDWANRRVHLGRSREEVAADLRHPH